MYGWRVCTSCKLRSTSAMVTRNERVAWPGEAARGRIPWRTAHPTAPRAKRAGIAAVPAIVNSFEAKIWSIVNIAASVCTFSFCIWMSIAVIRLPRRMPWMGFFISFS